MQKGLNLAQYIFWGPKNPQGPDGDPNSEHPKPDVKLSGFGSFQVIARARQLQNLLNGISDTVGIRKPDMSSFRMVDLGSVFEWSSFRMVYTSLDRFQVTRITEINFSSFLSTFCSFLYLFKTY